MKLEDVQDAAKRVIKPNAVVWVVVGDRTKIEESIKALAGRGQVHRRRRQSVVAPSPLAGPGSQLFVVVRPRTTPPLGERGRRTQSRYIPTGNPRSPYEEGHRINGCWVDGRSSGRRRSRRRGQRGARQHVHVAGAVLAMPLTNRPRGLRPLPMSNSSIWPVSRSATNSRPPAR